jgi:lipopolysaccharide/colanic/teichoic acid biosynthesis glycosyltransferase
MKRSSFAALSLSAAAPPKPAVFPYAVVKRILDVTVTAMLLVPLAPVLLGAAILVRLTSPGPVLFRQIRIGVNGREFQMLKFRSMYADADDRMHREMNICELLGHRAPPGTGDGLFKLKDDPRITRIGHQLRRYGIDELPQLLNVLRGEMSLVGPRPSLPWEVAMYTPEQCQRHQCLPGITGLWQVSERYALSMPEMLELDRRYADTRSIGLDIWILLCTPKAVLFGRSAR